MKDFLREARRVSDDARDEKATATVGGIDTSGERETVVAAFKQKLTEGFVRDTVLTAASLGYKATSIECFSREKDQPAWWSQVSSHVLGITTSLGLEARGVFSNHPEIENELPKDRRYFGRIEISWVRKDELPH